MLTLSSLSKEVQILHSQKRRKNSLHLKIEDDKTQLFSPNGDKLYIPSTTGIKFHHSDALVRLIFGPYGSGKTTICLHEIVRRACAMPVWYNGRRRSRWVIIRNTLGELTSTTLKSWLTWFEDLGDIRHRQKPLLTYEHTFNDGNGIVELEVIFLALDRPQDVAKLKSFELTGAYINETSEIPKVVLDHLKGRIGRYPANDFCPEGFWSGIIADTNGPEDDHWIYKMFEEESFEGHEIFHQPPGLITEEESKQYITNPEADNISHLPKDYYLKLAIGQTQEFINVYCLGQYGTVGTGKQVFPEFNSDLHAFEEVEPIQGHPLILGFDFGLTPACVVAQLTPHGTLLILKEYFAEGIGIRTFAESIVLPGLAQDFPYNKVGISVADPAGNKRDDIMEEMSCIGELCELGIETSKAKTNQIAPRLASVRYFLGRLRDGKPAFQLNRKACPILYKGFLKGYIYKRIAIAGEERYKDEPDKNRYSHTMDCLQYICLEVASDLIAQDKMPKSEPVDIFRPPMMIL